jgi:hypothetical protein
MIAGRPWRVVGREARETRRLRRAAARQAANQGLALLTGILCHREAGVDS